MQALVEPNKRLQELLNGEMNLETLGAIHRITYPLEDALQELDSKLAEVAEVL